MQPPRTFQLIVLGIFAVLIIFGMLVFSGKLSLPGGKQAVNYGEVTLWGTLPAGVVQTVIGDKLGTNQSVTIKYAQKNKATFDGDLVEALAAGRGPDLFLISQDMILHDLNKIALVPYQNVSERTFKDTYIQEGEMFLRPEGITALPFTIDPLVMYWNRDILTSAGIVAPPTKWSEFYSLAPKVAVRDQNGGLSRAFAPLGEYHNVAHAKEILSTLMMQAGSPIVATQDSFLSASLLASTDGSAQSPAMQATNFYTQFAQANKDSYAWNRSLPNSRDAFESGDLALYFGYASEYQDIRQKNPHLNFDVAPMPQADQETTRITFGQMQGLAMTKSSQNLPGAMYAALALSRSEVIDGVARGTGLPPVRRDLLIARPSDAAQAVFYDAALTTRAWIDPSPSQTDALFAQMIDSINSGRQKVSEAMAVLDNSINQLLRQYR